MVPNIIKNATYSKWLSQHLCLIKRPKGEFQSWEIRAKIVKFYKRSPRGWDVDNFLKPLIDLLSAGLGINDSKLDRIDVEKVKCPYQGNKPPMDLAILEIKLYP